LQAFALAAEMVAMPAPFETYSTQIDTLLG
jgi:hypothetical protein